MSLKTKIEWTDTTWNPVTGCTKVSPGCAHCYAERITNRFGGPGTFDKVVLHPDRLEAPLHWKKPRMVFVNSMSDLFHKDIPDEFIARVFAVMALCQQHTFQVLTKRAELMRAFVAHPNTVIGVWNEMGRDEFQRMGCPRPVWPLPNVWLGVSVENQAMADQRIPALLQTPAAIRWVSVEPLLGPVNLEQVCEQDEYGEESALLFPLAGEFTCEGRNEPLPIKGGGIKWVVVGGESGPGARPMHPEWPLALRGQCVQAGVPFFFKQWGEWTPDRPENYIRVSERRYSHETFAWAEDGSVYNPVRPPSDHFPSVMVFRVGKKRAGRLLDGRWWSDFPK